MSTCGRAVTAVHSVPGAETSPRHGTAPVPEGTGAEKGRARAGGYRQRIDMTRPTIIAPKPTAKL